MKNLILIMLAIVFSSQANAQSNFAATRAKIEQAMTGEQRAEADTRRDANRKPVETLEFFQFREGMQVLELVPAAGWYTKILAPTLRENGMLYVSLGTDGLASALLTQPGFDRVKVINSDVNMRGLEPFDFEASELDMVLTFRNLHNINDSGRAILNSAVYNSLKSGGLYGVIDHTRRHLEPGSRANGRRMDPVLVVKEIEDAGFEFVDFSDLHYRPVDDLSLEVGQSSVAGRTDRFTFLFRKP